MTVGCLPRFKMAHLDFWCLSFNLRALLFFGRDFVSGGVQTAEVENNMCSTVCIRFLNQISEDSFAGFKNAGMGSMQDHTPSWCYQLLL